jgi:hypothetical protein
MVKVVEIFSGVSSKRMLLKIQGYGSDEKIELQIFGMAQK